jgi:hypothetical protein
MALNRNSPNTTRDPEGDKAYLEEKVGKKSENEKIKLIAQHINRVWNKNQKDFKPVRKEMVETLRRVKGEYEPSKLALIKAFGGCSSYFRSGETKCRASESWIKDIYSTETGKAFRIMPSAIPDLPDETQDKIEAEVQAQIGPLMDGITNQGLTLEPEQLSRLVNDYYQEQLDAAREDIEEEAEERCKRAEKLIYDQSQEGGWDAALEDFLFWFVRTKFAIIKGPVLTKKKKQKWVPIKDSEGNNTLDLELAGVEELANDVYSCSPFNFYPSKGAKTIHDGDCIEIHELTLHALSNLIGVPGYDEGEIRAVIEKYETGALKSKWFSIDDETMVKSVTEGLKESANNTTPSTDNKLGNVGEKLLAQEFYGTVSGKMLKQWGIDADLDDQKQYQANCWKIGDHVIKAVLNVDALGRKPYHVSSWAKNPSSIVGEGMLEFAGPVEDAMNAIARALINNIAIASGPMSEEDADRIDEDIPIFPWRRIRSTSKQMKDKGPAVHYYQPQMHVQELVSAWNFFRVLMDEMTVPAYAQGAAQSGVTGGTATVFTQLLAAAARSIKAVVANIDKDIFVPYHKMAYDFNMKFSDDPTIKGDANIVAMGVKHLQTKEQQSQRKVEYLQAVSNPAYMQTLGAKNIGSILQQIAEANDIDLPDGDRLKGGVSAEDQLMGFLKGQAGIDPMQEQGQVGNGGGAPTGEPGENPDGSPAGVVNG